MRLRILTAAVVVLVSAGVAGDRAVTIQGWTPEEADGQDWGGGYFGRKDELWNDCYLAYELFCSRPGIDTNHARITMLWGLGSDYWQKGLRYDPRLLAKETG